MHTGEDSTQEMVEWKRVGGRGNRRREGGRRGEEVGGTYCCGLEAGRGMEEEEEAGERGDWRTRRTDEGGVAEEQIVGPRRL